MTTIEQFFTARGLAVDEALVVEALTDLLGGRLPAAGGVALPDADQRLLAEHAGVRPRPDDEREAVAAAAAAVVELAATARTVDAAATAAGVSPSRVRHWIGEGAVHAVKVGGRNLLPAWQFGPDGRPLPHLAEVLGALPDDLHPSSVAGFFATPQPELEVGGAPLAPAAWLLGGGEAAPVVALAEGLAVLL